MSQPVLYIPPEGLAFRLLGCASRKVLVSRSSSEPHFTHRPVDKRQSEQLFTLVNGANFTNSKHHRRRYALISKATGNFVICRSSSVSSNNEPTLWHLNRHAVRGEEWFVLEPGTGAFEGMFRLVNSQTKTVVFSRASHEPGVHLGSEPSTVPWLDRGREAPPRAEHYFKFLFEDTDFSSIEYALDKGRFVRKPERDALEMQSATNDTALQQNAHMEISTEEVHTGRWKYTGGFPIEAGTQFTTCIPMIHRGTVFKLDASQVDKPWKFGDAYTFTFSKAWKASFPVRLAPRETVRATCAVTRGPLEVPFVITLRSRDSGIKLRTEGVWQGTSTWDLYHNIGSQKTVY